MESRCLLIKEEGKGLSWQRLSHRKMTCFRGLQWAVHGECGRVREIKVKKEGRGQPRSQRVFYASPRRPLNYFKSGD